jgi:hypothetical protein
MYFANARIRLGREGQNQTGNSTFSGGASSRTSSQTLTKAAAVCSASGATLPQSSVRSLIWPLLQASQSHLSIFHSFSNQIFPLSTITELAPQSHELPVSHFQMERLLMPLAVIALIIFGLLVRMGFRFMRRFFIFLRAFTNNRKKLKQHSDNEN